MKTKIPKYNIVISQKLPNIFGIHILEGVFLDVLISVEKTSYDDLEEQIHCETYITHKPESLSIDKIDSEEFNIIIQTIIYEILQEVSSDEKGNDYSESFDFQ